MNKKYDRIKANQNCASASPCRSKSLRENYSLRLSPVGTAENVPGCNPGVPSNSEMDHSRIGAGSIGGC
jgi:hypothetical protein